MDGILAFVLLANMAEVRGLSTSLASFICAVWRRLRSRFWTRSVDFVSNSVRFRHVGFTGVV